MFGRRTRVQSLWIDKEQRRSTSSRCGGYQGTIVFCSAGEHECNLYGSVRRKEEAVALAFDALAEEANIRKLIAPLCCLDPQSGRFPHVERFRVDPKSL